MSPDSVHWTHASPDQGNAGEACCPACELLKSSVLKHNEQQKLLSHFTPPSDHSRDHLDLPRILRVSAGLSPPIWGKLAELLVDLTFAAEDNSHVAGVPPFHVGTFPQIER